MRDYAAAVYIGRFQPFHDGHLAVVKHGLEIAEKVIIVVGSVNSAPNIRNPWSFEEREEMIYASVEAAYGAQEGFRRVNVVGVRDYHYNMNSWIAEVQSKTDPFLPYGQTIALLGQYKDSSSYYLKHFPQWRFEPIKLDGAMIDATAIRTVLLRESFLPDWEGKLPKARNEHMAQIVERLALPVAVKLYLEEWIKSADFMKLTGEFKFIEEYKASWSVAPYPPIFSTADAIVVCSGHVLVVRRKINPGKGLLALPGGFIRPDELVEKAALRELREETGIRVAPELLQASIVASKVFDHPERSLRGRTISHGFYVKLPDGSLPEVSAGDDAAEAMWIPLLDVAKNEREFFDDHAHIINYFLSQS